MDSFRDASARVLVATDVAARGLDISGVTHVINFSVGMNIDMYVHRIGRCGRAGRAGIAHTFIVDGDERMVRPLIEILERNRQPVPRELVWLCAKIDRRDAKAAGAEGGDSDDDEEEVLRRENREKQSYHAKLRKQKGRGAQKAGGGGREGGRRR